MSLKPEYAPNETISQIWEERSQFIGDSILGFFAFGITFSIYVQCIYLLVPKAMGMSMMMNGMNGMKYPLPGKMTNDRKWAIFHILYCTLLFIFVGIGTGSKGRLTQLLLINNRNYPGGPVAFVHDKTNLRSMVWSWGGFTLAAWLQDGYALYRFLIFWNWNYWLGAFPTLVFLGAFASSIGTFTQIVRPNRGIARTPGRELLSAWYILSVSLNVIVTFAIVVKLLWKRKQIMKILGKKHSKLYTGIIAVLIESAALYSLFGLIYIGLFLEGKYSASLFMPIVGNLEAICPLLIIYRVSSGKGWTSETSNLIMNGQRPMSTMEILSTPPPPPPKSPSLHIPEKFRGPPVLSLSVSTENIAKMTTIEILTLAQSVTSGSMRSLTLPSTTLASIYEDRSVTLPNASAVSLYEKEMDGNDSSPSMYSCDLP